MIEPPVSEPSAHGASPAGDRGRGAAARAARHARRVPRIVRRAVGGVLRRRAHRELVGVRLAEQAQPVLPCSARRRSSRRRGRSSRGSSSRGRAEPFVEITSLSAIGIPSPALVVDDVQVGVQLAVARVDRRAVGGEELGAETSCASSRLDASSAVSAQGVDRSRRRHLEEVSSRSGAFANDLVERRQARGSSSAQAFAISSGCAVGGTSARSSSETFETPR